MVIQGHLRASVLGQVKDNIGLTILTFLIVINSNLDTSYPILHRTWDTWVLRTSHDFLDPHLIQGEHFGISYLAKTAVESGGIDPLRFHDPIACFALIQYNISA